MSNYEYPFDVGQGMFDDDSGRKFAGLVQAEVQCDNAQIFAVPDCLDENNILEEGEEARVYFDMQFARTTYDHEVDSIRNGKGEIIDIRKTTRFVHSFLTSSNEPTLKRLKLLKHFKDLFFSLDLGGSSVVFPITMLEVEEQDDKENAEHQLEISFEVEGEMLTTELCCDSPVSGNFQLDNCGDEVFAIPPDICEGSTVSIASVDNGDGSWTLTANTSGFTPESYFWEHDGNMIGTGNVITVTEEGIYCVYAQERYCLASDCFTITDDCAKGELRVESSGCNTLVTISDLLGADSWTLTINDGSSDVVDTSGTGNFSSAYDLGFGDYTATLTVNACDPIIVVFSVDECEEECSADYSGYSLSCEHNGNAFEPTFTGDEGVLVVNKKEFTLDGSTWGSYTGGSVEAETHASFKWTIKIEGCLPITLFSSCGRECPCPFPDDIGVTVLNDVNVNSNCCDDDGGGSEAPCPPPVVNPDYVNRIGTHTGDNQLGTYFSAQTLIHLQTDGGVYVDGSGGTTIEGSDDGVWDEDENSGTAPTTARFAKCGRSIGGVTNTRVLLGHCFNVISSGTFSIGFGAGNDDIIGGLYDDFKIFVDGQLVGHFEQNGGTATEKSLPYYKWHITEIFLNSGEHHIAVEVRAGANPDNFGWEVYQATNSQLQALTTVSEIDAMVISSSSDINNVDEAIGDEAGLICEEGTPYFDGCTPKCDCGGAGGGYTYESSLYHNDIFGDGTAGTRISLFYKGAFYSIIVGAANNVLIDSKTYNQAYADAINAAGIIGLSAENPTAADLTANCHSLDDLGDYKVRNLECIRIKFEVGEDFMMVFDSDPEQYLNQDFSSSCNGTGACSAYEIYNKCRAEYT